MSSGGDTVPDLSLSTIGGGIGGSTMFLPESAEGPSRGDSPDPKRQRTEKKMEIYEEQEESIEVDGADDGMDKEIYEEQEESIEVDGADDGMDTEIYEEQEQKDFLTEDDEESIEVDEAEDEENIEVDEDKEINDRDARLELDVIMESRLHHVPEDAEDDGDDVKTDNLDEIKKPKMSEKEIKEILEKVERETYKSPCVQHYSHTTAYLLSERFPRLPQLNGKSLEMYYMRLVPNVEYKRSLFDPFDWISSSDRDSQYVSLFSEFNKCGYFEEISYRTYFECPGPKRSKDFVRATKMANDLKLEKLTPSDIANCLLDVFCDRDIIATHLLKAEYDLYLLDCRFDQSLRPQDFTPKEDPPHPIFYSVLDFYPSAQQMDFDLWMENVGGSKMKKEECQNAIRARHRKNCEEDCTIRIRYIKLKRTIAKKLGLIQEED